MRNLKLPPLGDDVDLILGIPSSKVPTKDSEPMQPDDMFAMYVILITYEHNGRFLVHEEVNAVGMNIFGSKCQILSRNLGLLKKFQDSEHPATKALEAVKGTTRDEYEKVIGRWAKEVFESSAQGIIRARCLDDLKGRLVVPVLHNNRLTMEKRYLESWEYCLHYALARYYRDSKNILLEDEYIAAALAKYYGKNVKEIFISIGYHVRAFRDESKPVTDQVKQAFDSKACNIWTWVGSKCDDLLTHHSREIGEDEPPHRSFPESSMTAAAAESSQSVQGSSRTAPAAASSQSTRGSSTTATTAALTDSMQATSLTSTAGPASRAPNYLHDILNPTEPEDPGKGKGKGKEVAKRPRQGSAEDPSTKYPKQNRRPPRGGAGAGSSSTGRA